MTGGAAKEAPWERSIGMVAGLAANSGPSPFAIGKYDVDGEQFGPGQARISAYCIALPILNKRASA